MSLDISNRGNKMINLTKLMFSCLIGATCAVVSSQPQVANADDVGEFYAGKQVTIQVGFGPGGGFDLSARTFAKYFGKHIPGNPTVIVQNSPGAGSLNLANKLYNATEADGLTVGLITTSVLLEPLYGKRPVKIDPSEFKFIGSLDRDIISCGVWKGAGQGIKTLQDLINAEEPVVFGASRPSSTLSTFPMFFKNIFGANVKVVNGYRSSKDAVLAMQRGELDASCVFYEATLLGAYPDLLASGDLKIIVQLGMDKAVPTFGDATQITSLLDTEELKQMGELLFGPAEIRLPVVAPPGTPIERIAALRRALIDTANDPEMMAEAERLNLNFRTINGAEMREMFDRYQETPRDLIDMTYEVTHTKSE